MSNDDIKLRIVNEIKLRGYQDHYVDKIEEREILQIAIELGVSLESALAALNQACDELDYVLESRVVKQITDQLARLLSTNSKLSQADFDSVFASAKTSVQGKKPDRDVKKIVVETMEMSGHNQVKTGWFGNWYSALKKELGL